MVEKTLGLNHYHYVELIIGLIIFTPLFYLIYELEFNGSSLFTLLISMIVYFCIMYIFFSSLRFLNIQNVLYVNKQTLNS